MSSNVSKVSKVSKAFDWLAETPEGAAALKEIAGSGEKLRKAIPGGLDNSELKYVLQRLWTQRGLEGWDKEAHFDIQPEAQNEKLAKEIHLPTELNTRLRVRNGGFVIRASIPQALF